MEYYTYVLENGIRLICKPVSSLIAHAGLFINSGSRDEETNEHGLAHYIEHVLFKGTKKRKSYHILSRLEDVGGELNAYTTKEETCVHASFLKDDTSRALELIADIVFNSTFPEKEIIKEKEIIVDEINSYKDNPGEQIFDDFEELLFPNDPLGRNILGTPEGLKGFKRADVLKFIKRCYNTDQMVICFVGDISKNHLIKLVSKYFGSFLSNKREKGRKEVKGYQPFYKVLEKNTFQAHCIIGTRTFSFKDERRVKLHLLNNILGGPGMNSRLNLSLRERNGITYNIESSYNPYSDTGIFSVYFGTDKENIEKCTSLIFKEFELLKNKELGAIQLSKAKKQLIGQLAISSENNENQMLGFGKSYMVFDHVDTLEEINQQIEAVKANEIRDIANELFQKDKLSIIIFK